MSKGFTFAVIIFTVTHHESARREIACRFPFLVAEIDLSLSCDEEKLFYFYPGYMSAFRLILAPVNMPINGHFKSLIVSCASVVILRSMDGAITVNYQRSIPVEWRPSRKLIFKLIVAWPFFSVEFIAEVRE
ncbi:hypothetical protein ACLEEZ_06965 [Lonsdalea quercina]|uniref:hypothetical protein n=1 Tax=Lonsdalea quercina TaxID=71657 RepID=UPI003976CEFE